MGVGPLNAERRELRGAINMVLIVIRALSIRIVIFKLRITMSF